MRCIKTEKNRHCASRRLAVTRLSCPRRRVCSRVFSNYAIDEYITQYYTLFI